MRRLIGVLMAAIICQSAIVTAQDAVAMRSILDALIELMPLALHEDRFADPDHAATIDGALERLANNALMIDAHTSGLGPSYDLLRRTMANDTREAVDSWDAGDLRHARFVVGNLAHDCFACHSRLPADTGSPALSEAAATVALDSLPPRERMRWLVATRQFDAAMRYAEEALADTSVSAAELDRQGLFEDYLKVTLRVGGDAERPLTTLTRFAERDDLPVYLQLQTSAWIESLRALDPRPTDDRLAAGRRLLSEARELNLYLQDRRGLVQATMASGLLHAYVLDPSPAAAERAEAYYLLGLAESVISRELWVPETEYFLELAIRTAPATEVARDAYAFLEQYVFANYSGSGGIALPDEVAERLRRLRELVEG